MHYAAIVWGSQGRGRSRGNQVFSSFTSFGLLSLLLLLSVWALALVTNALYCYSLGISGERPQQGEPGFLFASAFHQNTLFLCLLRLVFRFWLLGMSWAWALVTIDTCFI